MTSRTPVSAAAGPVLVLAWLAATFGGAGTLRWASGWLYVLALGGGLLLHRRHVARRNPGVLERRRGIGEGTPTWDRAWLAVFWPLMVAVPLVAGIDVGRGRHPPLRAAWAWPAGVALLGAGLAISARAMAVNPFFEGTVRLQPSQRVIDAGPYRRVRHPGYVGLALWPLATPLLLRSRWALAPALLAAGWVVVRTALEDRLLRRRLAGYAGYAARVRHRLVPGIW
jgi:protein-S-isoprenylcysteine O-methyltransferase Ste14